MSWDLGKSDEWYDEEFRMREESQVKDLIPRAAGVGKELSSVRKRQKEQK